MGYRHSRQEILDGALATAMDDGLSQLTFGRVAKRLGINDRTVVYYFPTKDALITEVVEDSPAAEAGLKAGASFPLSTNNGTLGVLNIACRESAFFNRDVLNLLSAFGRIVGATLVARWSLGLIRDTSGILLDHQAPGAMLEKARQHHVPRPVDARPPDQHERDQ